MVLAPRCLHKRSTVLPPFPLAPVFATLQTLIGTDKLVRRVSASIFGITSPDPALPPLAPALPEHVATCRLGFSEFASAGWLPAKRPLDVSTAHRFRNAACPPPQFANNS